MLALTGAWFFFERVIAANFDARGEFVTDIVNGTAPPPYRFRILLPYVGLALEHAAGWIIRSPYWQHLIAYGTITLATFAGIFVLFRGLLERWFPRPGPLIGCLLLAAVIPLSITGLYADGDFVVLLVYVAGLRLMEGRRDGWVPVLVGVGTLIRAQCVFLVVFHVLHLLARGELRAKRKAVAAGLGFVAWAVVFLWLRAGSGNVSTPFTWSGHLAANFEPYVLVRTVLPIWIAEVGGLGLLCAVAYRASNRFFRLALWALAVYAALFALNGLLWEMAKFLPAFLILIPMALQPLTGRYVPPPPSPGAEP